MRRFLITFSVAASLPILGNAQITITSEDVDPIGFVALQAQDTTLDASVNAGGSGSQTWDFSALKVQASDTLRVTAPSETPYSSFYPSANLAAKIDTAIYAYFEKNDDQLKLVGSYGKLAYGPFQLETGIFYNPTQSLIRFPMELNGAYSEVVKSVIQVPGSAVGAPYDSVRLVTITERDVLVDAFGQLTTPTGSYETIRSTETEISLDSVYIKTGIWFPLSGTDPDTTVFYNWWSNQNGLGFPVVQLQFNPDNGTSEATWLKELVSGTTLPLPTVAFSVAPNPSNGRFQVALPEQFQGSVEVLDLQGRPVTTLLVSGGSQPLDLPGAQTGIFLLVLKNQQNRVVGFKKIEIVR